MDAEFTVDSFYAYLKDLDMEDSGSTLSLSKPCALKQQFEVTPPSQKTLNTCLMIGVSCLSLPIYEQHIPHVVAVLKLLLQYSAKWDGSTCRFFDHQTTPYHIICQTTGDYYELLDMTITSSGRELVNETDYEGCTAVMRAVQFKNIECLGCLITHGADLNIGSNLTCTPLMSPLFRAIFAESVEPSPITRDILNLLLESGVNVNKSSDKFWCSPIEYAIDKKSIDCVEKLVQKKAQFEPIPLLFRAERDMRIDILVSLINLGFSKNVTDSLGRNALYHAVCSCDITFIRYLLEAGVTIITTEEQQHRQPCYQEARSRIMDLHKRNDLRHNPCLKAISLDMLDVVQLLEDYDQQTFQSIEALKCAVRIKSFKMVNYLLNKYKYTLNMEYRYFDTPTTWHWSKTIITEACKPDQLEMVTLLMEHGADPAKKSDAQEYKSALLIAIRDECNELLAHFIRSGVNLDCRLHDLHLGDVLPFEYAVFMCNESAAAMLLYAGCSCGEFSLADYISTGKSFSVSIGNLQRTASSEFQKLLIEWNVHRNNVKPLDQLCRKLILNHLCPRAVRKIKELPLPSRIFGYLSISGLEE